MTYILKVNEQEVIRTLAAKGFSLRRIARELGVNRRTVARYAGVLASKCATVEAEVSAGSEEEESAKCTREGGEVTAGSRSSCAPHGSVIDGLVGEGLTAQRVWEELRKGMADTHFSNPHRPPSRN